MRVRRTCSRSPSPRSFTDRVVSATVLLRGTVVEFDEDRGLGSVVDDRGTKAAFHCVEISDGSRRIPVGSRVTYRMGFRVRRWEATDLRVASA